MADWFCIENMNDFDSPCLVVYPDRIRENIRLAICMIGDINRLRPHVKTNKMAEVCAMMMEAGITKFKCATIAEAEMLGMIQAPDVLLAYQPVGPKMLRLFSLVKKYSNTAFSCLTDNKETARQLNELSARYSIQFSIFIDVNVGMNRTGISPEKVLELAKEISSMKSLSLAGLHVYDGHIHDSDIILRQQNGELAYGAVTIVEQQLSAMLNYPITTVAGGTPTFPIHSQKKNVECSPGTFVFSDWGYKHLLPDEPFVYAALVITRVISVLDNETICVDLGHKSVAAENPLPRVHFLNAPDVVSLSQSEEHLVLKVPPESHYKTGDILYGVPVHICPTVALYDSAFVAENGTISKSWKVVARDRAITI